MVSIGLFFTAFSLLAVFVIKKYVLLKKQIRKLTRQLEELSQGNTEKILDIALIDRDLELLAGSFNRYYEAQRQKVASSLRHEERFRESVANISHDLWTPLTVIIGHLQLLCRSELTPDQLGRVEMALQKADRLKELVRSFYELSVLDGNETTPRLERINLSNLLADFLAENAAFLEDRGIQPKVEIPDASVFVLSDRAMLERILQNLLTNTVKYSAGGVSVRLYQSMAEKAVICYENMVEGSHLPDIDRMFDRFYTGDKSRNGESTGLGLAVVRLLAEKLGGEVHASLKSDILCIELLL